MTTYETPELSFRSAPIGGDTKATVDLVANDWMAPDDWDYFWSACMNEANANGGVVDPNRVREWITRNGQLQIHPRRYSAFWSRAAGKNGFLVADGWVVNDDVAGGNRGKPLRRYRIRT